MAKTEGRAVKAAATLAVLSLIAGFSTYAWLFIAPVPTLNSATLIDRKGGPTAVPYASANTRSSASPNRQLTQSP